MYFGKCKGFSEQFFCRTATGNPCWEKFMLVEHKISLFIRHPEGRIGRWVFHAPNIHRVNASSKYLLRKKDQHDKSETQSMSSGAENHEIWSRMERRFLRQGLQDIFSSLVAYVLNTERCQLQFIKCFPCFSYFSYIFSVG